MRRRTRLCSCVVGSVVTGGGGGLCGGDGEWHGGSSSTPIYSSESSTPPRYSSGASTPQSYSLGTSRNAQCSNCKHFLDKITVLEATVDMYMHPEQHTINSAALFYEVYHNMGKLDLE
uniref:Uncharacterized protein n=1 Tax=Tanacetum cinerariifolium TaxID=118510 RepID=A0A699ID81_TANCI|nr:hypothetical protein [Tanacetum cinerariifolium]